ncbi:uncharacterized protein LOC129248689 [Anastrepha obliqua]|uniref:uncharacterized protein LOC129248689 n=1 Tax=Anastrepha obliqua TaxID=95512 RepID=UPI0024094FFD|nr:uncharacterized protein LOC129248689 [Anastrepha obliqua]
MKLLAHALFAFFTFCNALKADEVKEARYIDENALKAILDLTRQGKPPNPVVALKPQYPYLTQQEKLTLQGERQTHYPLQPVNVEYALLPQSILTQTRPATPTKDALVDVKPIYIPYPLKNHPTFTQAAYQAFSGLPAIAALPQSKLNYVTSFPIYNPPPPPAEQTKAPTYFTTYPTLEHKHTLEHNKQPAYQHHTYPNLFAYANQATNQLIHQQARPDHSYQSFATTNSPSFIIINPSNYPSYHYYAPTNYTFPRAVAIEDEPLEPIEAEQEIADNNRDLRLETVHSSQPGSDGSAIEIEPIFTATPNQLTNDERVLAQALLEQTRQLENLNALVELFKREQLKRRMQERVAAFYFRNYNVNKK